MKLKGNVLLVALLVIALSFTAFGCGGSSAPEGTSEGEDGPPIVVTSKTFTESIILGEMLVELLEHHGYPVKNEVGLGETAIIRPALASGEVSIYYEYTGTVLITQMQHEAIYEPEECYNTVKEWDLETNGIVWLDYAPGNNTDVMMTRPGFSEEYGVTTISELIDKINNGEVPKLKVALRDEWYEREDGFGRFRDIYGLNEDLVEITFIGMGLEYDALREGQIDISFGFATDGRIAAFDLDIIEDDKNCFAVYNPAPTVKKEILDAYPEIEGIINELSALLDNDALAELNKRVDVDGLETDQVAKEFLEENGLI